MRHARISSSSSTIAVFDSMRLSQASRSTVPSLKTGWSSPNFHKLFLFAYFSNNAIVSQYDAFEETYRSYSSFLKCHLSSVSCFISRAIVAGSHEIYKILRNPSKAGSHPHYLLCTSPWRVQNNGVWLQFLNQFIGLVNPQ